MNKSELAAAVAAKTGMTKKAAEEAVAATFEAIVGAVKKGDKVAVLGFGTFEAKQRAAREGHNPATGAKIKIAACKAPAFKAGKGFKDAIN
ncbi:MAG: HU family DNA-binding protein [Eubacteriales bacterium]|nr:HU family DNA-binding protein [Eubacteriales bacterium]